MILICEHHITTVTCLTLATVIFSTWYPATRVNICCCTLHSHQHLTCYTWHVISNTDTWYVILDYWFMTLNIWHRHLICYTWHLISDTWYLTLVLNMLYLTPDPDTWYLTPVLDMLSLSTWYLTPDIWHLTIDMLPLTWHAFIWY